MALMRALVKTERDEPGLELLDVQMPEPGPGELLIKVAVAGICGSDMPIYRGQAHWLKTPRIPGHEWSGEVVETGENVDGFVIEDRVSAEVLVPCGGCEFCLSGRRNLCTRAQGIGFSRDGAFAEYILLPAGPCVHHLPDGVEHLEAAGAEPAAVVVHGISRSGLCPGGLAVVVGPGAIGLYALQVTMLRGANTVVIGTDGDDGRLEIATGLGAIKTINSSTEDAGKILDEVSGGRGPDLVVESSGHPAGIETTYNLARRGGEVVQLGRMHGGAGISSYAVDRITQKELTVYGAFAETWSAFEQVLELMEAGLIKTEPLVTHRLPLERAGEGFDAIESRDALKVMLDIKS